MVLKTDRRGAMRLDDGGKVLAVSYIRMRMSLAAVTLCLGGWKFCCNSWS